MPKLIDANVILRYILNDNHEMYNAASEVIQNGAFTTAEVLAEVVYVLKGVYKVDRLKISECLSVLLAEVKTDFPEVYYSAFSLFASRSLDFVDCILIARHQILGNEVFSFDKKLNRCLEQTQ